MDRNWQLSKDRVKDKMAQWVDSLAFEPDSPTANPQSSDLGRFTSGLHTHAAAQTCVHTCK